MTTCLLAQAGVQFGQPLLQLDVGVKGTVVVSCRAGTHAVSPERGVSGVEHGWVSSKTRTAAVNVNGTLVGVFS